MGWNIRGDRIVSDEEAKDEARGLIQVLLYVIPPALAFWGASYFIGTNNAFERIIVAAIVFAAFVYSVLNQNKIVKFVGIVIAGGFLAFMLLMLAALVISILSWIFHF